MHEFEPLIGSWRVEGTIPTEPPLRITGEATIEARWERGMGEAGDQWQIDFPLTYVRR